MDERETTPGTPESSRPIWNWHLIGLVIVLAIGLVVRLKWLHAVDTQPVTDFNWYYERAVSIAGGFGYSVHGIPTAYWPVGYPAFLAAFFKLFGASVELGKVLNTVLTLCCVGLGWALGWRLFKSPWVGHLVGLALAVHPAFVAYSGILASEPLYTSLSLSVVALILFSPRKFVPWMIAAGVFGGLATLVRPQAVLIPLLVACCAWLCDNSAIRGQFLKSLAWCYVACLLVLVPWTIRNYTVFHHFVFVSTNGGDNLLIGNSELSNGKYLNPEALGYDIAGLGEIERDKASSGYAKRYISEHRSQIMGLWPAKLEGTFLTGTDAPYWAFQRYRGNMQDPGTGADKTLFKKFQSYSLAVTGLLIWGAAIGALLSLLTSKRLGLALIPIAIIGYTALLTVVFFGNARFAFPAIPFMIMLMIGGGLAPIRLGWLLLSSKRREVDL